MSAPALAATVQNFKQKGAGADATWYQSDGCGYSSVSVYFAESVTPGSGGSASKYVNLSASKGNYCTGVFSYSFTPDVFATQTNFSVSSSLTKATLTGTIPTYECAYTPSGYNCGSHTVAVNLTWVNTDSVTRNCSSYQTVSSTGMFSFRAEGSSRSATASGSIVQDSTVSLITGDSTFGDIFKSMTGEIAVVHP